MNKHTHQHSHREIHKCCKDYSFIRTRAEMHDWIKHDFKFLPNILHRLPQGLLAFVFKHSGLGLNLTYLYFTRHAEYHHNLSNKIRLTYYEFKRYKLGNIIGLEFPVNTVGKGVVLNHPGPRVINWDTLIGENSIIHSGVQVGGANKIGKNVYIGMGAKIFGDVIIADGCKIGANSVVNSSFTTPNTTIVGVPGKAVKK